MERRGDEFIRIEFGDQLPRDGIIVAQFLNGMGEFVDNLIKSRLAN